MRVGLALGYDPTLGVREMAGFATDAEARGYDMLFFSEALLGNRDSVTAVAAFGLATRTIALGFTQVVRLRSPLLMAQTLASLDELTNRRIVCAPGACTDKHARRHGLPPAAPAQTLTEWIETVRLLLRGEAVTYRGQHVSLEGTALNWRPIRAHIPFWNAAMTRTGFRLAARLADGVLLDAHTSPEYVENAVAILRAAVRDAGRDWERFEVAQIIPCSVEDTHDEAIEAMRWEAASRFDSPNLAAETGRRLRVGEPAIDPNDFPRLVEAQRAGGRAAVAKALPRRLLENTTASGTPDEVLARVARYRRAGVTLPLVRPQARHQLTRVVDLFARR